MALAILGIVGTVLSFAVWLWKRKATNADTPEAQRERRREQFHENLFKGDSIAESVRADDLVRELKNKNHPNRPDGSDSKAG